MVAVGGGHGQAAALEAIQSYAGRIGCLVTVADDGGSSGRLTSLGIPPPGDVRRCLLALTPEPTLWSELFAHRFEGADVDDHSLGNLILAGLTDLFGDFSSAVSTAGRMLGALGEVIPVSNEPVTLSAVVDGQRITGQVAVALSRGHISELSLEPEDVLATRQALAAVSQADQIVFGPGSLYTSVMAALKVQMLAPAVMDARAQRVLVLNLISQDGETLGMQGGDHLDALAEHVGITGPGVVIVNDGPVDVPDGHEQVGITKDDAARHGWDVVSADLVDRWAEWPAHDPIKLGSVLEEVLDA